jgi:hypothetical protein
LSNTQPLCEGITTVVPSDWNNNNSTNGYMGVDVAVYKRTDTLDAKDWLNNDLLDGALTQTQDPQAINQSTQSINGYSAFTYTTQYTEPDEPITVTYVVVDGSYAVVVTSTTQTIAPSPGTENTTIVHDYSQYLPAIQSFVYSIKFH